MAACRRVQQHALFPAHPFTPHLDLHSDTSAEGRRSSWQRKLGLKPCRLPRNYETWARLTIKASPRTKRTGQHWQGREHFTKGDYASWICQVYVLSQSDPALTLTSGTAALGVDSKDSEADARAPGHDGTKMADAYPSCHYLSDNALYFTLAEVHDNTTVIAISTQWHITYFSKLRERFKKEMNATIVGNPGMCSQQLRRRNYEFL